MNLLKKLSSKENIKSAFRKAIKERCISEHAALISEIEYANKYMNEIIDDIEFELSSISHYSPEAGFYYSKPKSELVDRFIVYLPLKELIIRYAFIQVIAESIDAQLINNCFANRLSVSDNFLTESYSRISWPKYCNWQNKQALDNEQLIVTDLSGYYDSVSHEKLISIIARRMGITESAPFLIYFGKILQQKVMLNDGSGEFITLKKGLITGPCCEGILANIYLSDIDDILERREGIEYGRYVDDIRLFSNDEACLKSAFKILQSEMKKLGLNLNSSKTKYVNEKEQVIILLKELFHSYNQYGEEEEYLQEKTEVLKPETIETDLLFEERKPEFDRKKIVVDAKEASDFCTILNILEIKEWTKKDIANLIMIIKKFPSASKFAAWLIVSPIFFDSLDSIRKLAIDNIFNEILPDENIHPYTKTRILHHLINQRVSLFSCILLDCVRKRKDFYILDINIVGKSLLKCAELATSDDMLILYCLEALNFINPKLNKSMLISYLNDVKHIKKNNTMIKAIKYIDLHDTSNEWALANI